MKYVSSDTNVWIDFSLINKLDLPFRLPFTFIMSQDAIDDELLSPSDFRAQLLDMGLVPVQYSYEEFKLAEEFGELYPRLSVYDCLALAIAKNRKIVLLTGDGALRKAAVIENVDLIGTIGVLDLLHSGKHISTQEYKMCLSELKRLNGGQIRLPKNEIDLRLKRCETESF